MHLDEVVARFRTAWGLQRAGGRIQAAVEQDVRRAISRGTIKSEGDFLAMPSWAPTLRNRQHVLYAGLRRPEMIVPSELSAGIMQVMKTNYGATDEELASTLSRLLDFKAMSAQLRAVIAAAVEKLLKTASLSARIRC